MVWVRVGLCLGWVTAGVSFEIRTDGWLRFSCGWVWFDFELIVVKCFVKNDLRMMSEKNSEKP